MARLGFGAQRPFDLNTEIQFRKDRLFDDGWIERTEVIQTLSDGTEITAEDAVVMMCEHRQRTAAAVQPTIATAKQRTSNGPKTPKTRVEREQLLLAYLSKHKDDPDAANIRDAERETGVPRATIGNLPMWEKFIEWRKSTQPSEVRTTPLTEAMLAVMMDQSSMSNDPAEIAARRAEELALLIEDQRYDDNSDRR